MRTAKNKKHGIDFEPLEDRRLMSATLTVGAGQQYTTLQAAANAVQAGDTVVVQAGTYAGFQMVDKATGTAAAPIVFDFLAGAKITSADGSTGDAIDIEGCDYVTIKGATITNSNGSVTRAGIRLAECDHFSVVDNTVSGMGEWGLYTSHSSYGLMQGNSVSGSISQHGIYIANSSTQDQILDNTVFNNAGSGIQLNGDASQGDSGIMTDCTVSGNIIYGNGAIGGSGINCDGVQDSVISDNLIYDNHNAKGICLFKDDSGAGPSGDVIVNNTIIYPGANTIQITDEVGPNTIFNNILIGNSAWSSSDKASNNLVAASVPSGLFTNASGGNYTLASGSTAVGAGVASFNGASAPTVSGAVNEGADLAGNVSPTGTTTSSGSTGSSSSSSSGSSTSGSSSGSSSSGSTSTGSTSSGTSSSGSTSAPVVSTPSMPITTVAPPTTTSDPSGSTSGTGSAHHWRARHRHHHKWSTSHAAAA